MVYSLLILNIILLKRIFFPRSIRNRADYRVMIMLWWCRRIRTRIIIHCNKFDELGYALYKLNTHNNAAHYIYIIQVKFNFRMISQKSLLNLKTFKPLEGSQQNHRTIIDVDIVYIYRRHDIPRLSMTNHNIWVCLRFVMPVIFVNILFVGISWHIGLWVWFLKFGCINQNMVYSLWLFFVCVCSVNVVEIDWVTRVLWFLEG